MYRNIKLYFVESQKGNTACCIFNKHPLIYSTAETNTPSYHTYLMIMFSTYFCFFCVSVVYQTELINLVLSFLAWILANSASKLSSISGAECQAWQILSPLGGKPTQTLCHWMSILLTIGRNVCFHMWVFSEYKTTFSDTTWPSSVTMSVEG